MLFNVEVCCCWEDDGALVLVGVGVAVTVGVVATPVVAGVAL